MYNYIILKNENVNKNLKTLVDVDGPSYACKMVEIHHKKKLSSIINIYFEISKKLGKVIMISKSEFKSFQINLMLKLFICLILELLKLHLNFYPL